MLNKYNNSDTCPGFRSQHLHIQTNRSTSGSHSSSISKVGIALEVCAARTRGPFVVGLAMSPPASIAATAPLSIVADFCIFLGEALFGAIEMQEGIYQSSSVLATVQWKYNRTIKVLSVPVSGLYSLL